MADIQAFLGSGVFDPDTTNAMSSAFEHVCRILGVNGDARERETIAARIIELAERGERDPVRLRETILRDRGSETAAG